MKINVFDIIGQSAISREAGNKIHKELKKMREEIEIDFSNVKFYASPFFNASIAPFLEESSLKDLQEKFTFVGLSPLGKKLLNQVIHNAVEFYSKSEVEKENIIENIQKGAE